MATLWIQRLAFIIISSWLLQKPQSIVCVNAQDVQGEVPLPAELPIEYRHGALGGPNSVSKKLLWNGISMRYAKDDNNVVTILLSSGPYEKGWLGIGFSKERGMDGSSSMVAYAAKDGKPNIKQYTLEGKVPSEDIPNNGTLLLTNLAPFAHIKGSLNMAFQLKFPQDNMKQHVIFSLSHDSPDSKGILPKHTERKMMEFDFAKGTANKKDPYKATKTAHGVMGILAWDVFFAFGILFPLGFKHIDPQWFHLHITFQCTGYIVNFVTMCLGLKLASDIHIDGQEFNRHRAIGITLFVISTLQVLALVARPAVDSSKRKLWRSYHHTVGYVADVLGFVNVFLGIRLAGGGIIWNGVHYILLTIHVIASLVLGTQAEKRKDKENATENAPPPIFHVDNNSNNRPS